MPTNKLIALDADGVLVDYHQAYALAWHRTFDEHPEVLDQTAYWPFDRYKVRRLDIAERELFRNSFDHDLWSSIPLLPGVQAACNVLVAAGHDLVCVTALPAKFQSARLKNLQDAGLPIDRVIATGTKGGGISPKAAALHELDPLAFVDDYAAYFRGINPDIHRALVLREPTGSPNAGEVLGLADSQHTDLADFVTWWLSRAASVKREEQRYE